MYGLRQRRKRAGSSDGRHELMSATHAAWTACKNHGSESFCCPCLAPQAEPGRAMPALQMCMRYGVSCMDIVVRACHWTTDALGFCQVFNKLSSTVIDMANHIKKQQRRSASKLEVLHL